MGRRIANEALRVFIRTVDFDQPALTDVLFTCSTCEVPLTKQDMEDIGIEKEQAEGLKKFRGVMVDGTSQGILGDLPKYEDRALYMDKPKGLGRSQKLLKRKGAITLMKKLFSTTRAFYRSEVAKSLTYDNRDAERTVRFSVTSKPPQHVRCDTPFTSAEAFHVRTFINKDACRTPNTACRNHDACQNAQRTKKEHPEVTNFLRSLLSLGYNAEAQGPRLGSDVQAAQIGAQQGEEEDTSSDLSLIHI